jgi:hypothetical protein
MNSRPHEAQVEDQKPTKSSRKSFRISKSCKTNKMHEKRQVKPKWQRIAKKGSKTQKAHKTKKLPLN